MKERSPSHNTKATPTKSSKGVTRIVSLTLAWLLHYKHSSRRALLIASAAVALAVVFCILAIVYSTKTQPALGTAQRSVHQKKTATPSGVVAYRLLDGVQGTDAQPIGVMIENLVSVRPQAGLSAASVVYETYAEGGSIRFLAVFSGAGGNLPKIGPVRSVRPYYLEWLSEYDGMIAHAGGSPEGLQTIEVFDIKDLNALSGSQQYFFRDHGIPAPHNLFTSSEQLSRAIKDRNLTEPSSTFLSWNYKDDLALAARPAQGISPTIAFSGRSYEVRWQYDPATNTYLRFNGGVPHLDANTGAQLRAKNVIVEILSPIAGVGEKGRLTLNVHGTGKAYLFTDGGISIGTWSKADRTNRTTFTYENGTAAVFNRGATWVEVVPEDKGVTYGANNTP